MTWFFLSKRENIKAGDLHIWMGIVEIPAPLNSPLTRFEETYANYLYIHSAPNHSRRVSRIMKLISGLPFLRITSSREYWEETGRNVLLFSVSIVELIQKLFIWEWLHWSHFVFFVLTTEDNKIVGLCKLSICCLCIILLLSVFLSHHIQFGPQTISISVF